VWVESHITQGACAYPITSSTTMGSGYQAVIANAGPISGEIIWSLSNQSRSIVQPPHVKAIPSLVGVLQTLHLVKVCFDERSVIYNFWETTSRCFSYWGSGTYISFIKCPCRA
jgi:hypothetical protein